MASQKFHTFTYTNLPAMAKLRVAIHPDAKSEWCEYGPDNYNVPVFLKGIFHDVYMGVITNLKASIVEPWLKEFIEDNPEAFLGDGFRHIEAGLIFPEEYIDIDRADESLAPVSGHHLNIITETDRTIEKWKVRIGWTRDIFARYFKEYSTFQEFMKLLEGNMTKGINKSLALIVKAVMCADPSQTVFDDKDIARIFGRTADNTAPDSPAQDEAITPARSSQGRKWNTMMRKLIQKYYGKSIKRWPNVQWYNPSYFSFDHDIEEMNKGDIYEEVSNGKDKSKRQMQKLYTDAHETSVPQEKTIYLRKIWRVDCLMALVDTIIKALIRITTEETTRFWLGNDRAIQMAQTKAGAEQLKQRIREQGLEGQSLLQDSDPINSKGAGNPDTSLSFAEGFQVTASPEDLILLLNPEDYADLEVGVARRGQMDTRAINLDLLKSRVSTIYPMRGMKAGFARLIDKRAFKILPFFQMTDIVQPGEKVAWRALSHFQFAVRQFNLFAGCLFIPTPHFVASPDFYDEHGLLGQEIEKNK